MKAVFALAIGLALSVLGCTQQPITLPLRSLERSGAVSFVCVDTVGAGHGHDINSCPDFDNIENPRRMLGLVTQTLRGEVAVIDLTAGTVVDTDTSTPGFSFLPVGANPTDIVSTPGSEASFVGVADPGKEGIFAIPSSCLRAPAHDLVSWPACALPWAPGKMELVIDAPNPNGDGSLRASCDGPYTAEAATPGAAVSATRDECPADLALELSPPGRRKLVVSLPLGEGFAIIDAQSILDREPGSYDPCEIERYVKLTDLDAPAIAQKIPADLQAPGCTFPTVNYGPKGTGMTPQPAGIDLADDGRLFISDLNVPLIHVWNLSDPCSPTPEPSLLPQSFESPNRVVTTSAVAVSPATTQGKRFAYAVDPWDGSVMAFDVTPGSSDRTPLVFPGSPRIPFQAPDRVQLSAPAKDVIFALRDAPVADPITGVATIGTYCNPDPAIANADTSNAAVKYRPNSDYSRGAGPRNLRGVFGFAMLTDGQIAVIDVEDFDAPCRRPIEANSAAKEDFRGCFGDPKSVTTYVDADEKRTVSDEQSCRIFEQHRPRSGRVMINATQYGVNSPAIKNFPRLRAKDGSGLATDFSDEGLKHPRLLAVDFPSPSGGTPEPATVYIGTDLFQNAPAGNGVNAISVDPAVADQLSVVLNLNEPRSFGGDEDMTLTFEGPLLDQRKTGHPVLADPSGIDQLDDQDGNFCNRGVEDFDLAKERGAELGVDPANLDVFARDHADFVQVANKLHGEDSLYWENDISEECRTTIGNGKSVHGKSAFLACQSAFGEGEGMTVQRDFRILHAYQSTLVIEPRSPGDLSSHDAALLARCCLGSGQDFAYNIRGGNTWILRGSLNGFRHNVLAAGTPEVVDKNGRQDRRCIRDCNPRRKLQNSRAFEISARDCEPPAGATEGCVIGKAGPTDYACVLDKSAPLTPGGPQSQCIFENLTHRFAIYRGSDTVELIKRRDQVFAWTVTGSFVPLTASLLSQSRAVSPESIEFVPQLGQLAVADAASEGLVMISLDSVAVTRLFF